MRKSKPMMSAKLLRGGRIYTGDSSHPWAYAVAIANGRVIGLDAEAEAWASHSQADIEDMHGATLLPGITDAHIHLMWYAQSLREIDLRDCTREGMLAQVRQRAAEVEPAEWILGRGWDQNLWSDVRFPTAEDLDHVAPHHPAMLIAKNAHALVANSVAMRLADVTGLQEDPPRGKIGRDQHGRPNGMFFEEAMGLIKRAVPPVTLQALVQLLETAQAHLLASGITGVHDVDGAPAFAAFQELRQSGRLRIRIVKYLRLEALDGLIETGMRSGYGDAWLHFGGLKLFADGALGARTAAMFSPYEGEPDNTGILTLDAAQLETYAHRAVEGGLALAVHAIGDRTNRLVLDVIERVIPMAPRLRHRVEHVQLIDPADQGRFGRLGVVASMQPIHATHDRDMAEQYWGERARHAYAWRALAEQGAVLAFGSDAPIEVFDPFLGLYAAVTRCTESPNRPRDAWYPEQCLTLPEALRAYTWGAAYAAGLENRRGTLMPGQDADLIVLDRNIFELPAEALLDVTVKRTMVGGVWQYQA